MQVGAGRLHGARPQTLAACGALLVLLAAASASCGTSGPPAAPPPRTAAPLPSAATQPGPLHGFDPRRYAGKRPLSMQRGAASFYADRFAGRKTANGERYDPNAYTCAHRTLPFGSVLRVTHERTGDWVLVRVNDRGPYGPGKRIVDLSRQAARRLSMLREGVARVRLEVLELGQR
jgi:rare lipoprotein A